MKLYFYGFEVFFCKVVRKKKEIYRNQLTSDKKKTFSMNTVTSFFASYKSLKLEFYGFAVFFCKFVIRNKSTETNSIRKKACSTKTVTKVFSHHIKVWNFIFTGLLAIIFFRPSLHLSKLLRKKSKQNKTYSNRCCRQRREPKNN